ELTQHASGVYFVLNPLKPEFLSRRADDRLPVVTAKQGEQATDQDVLCRRWLIVEADPERHPKDSCATNDEKAEARKVILAVRKSLTSLSWPDPVRADSGNGYYPLYRIDLPNDDESLALVKQILAALGAKFDSVQAHIDQSVCNAARLFRVPGTWN